MREDQQDCQQQMMEILEKVSDQVKKVENIHSGSMSALGGSTILLLQAKWEWMDLVSWVLPQIYQYFWDRSQYQAQKSQ